MSDITITGNIVGVGTFDYYLNDSKTKAHNPILNFDSLTYESRDCPIAAIEYVGFSPNKIINIKSKENSVYENTLDYHMFETLEWDSTLNYYKIKHYPQHPVHTGVLHYLLTNYYSDDQKGNPLFYQYELKFDSYSDISGLFVKNIYKNNEVRIDPKEYVVQYSNDLLGAGSGRYSETTWVTDNAGSLQRIRVLLPFEFISYDTFYVVEYEKFIYGVRSYQKELIELEQIYESGFYNITSSGLELPIQRSYLKNGDALTLVKDPTYRINPLDIVALKGENAYMSDIDVQWKLRINTGSFYVPSGIYNAKAGNIYNMIVPNGTYSEQPLTNIKPTIVNSNILKVKESPVYIQPTYTYPLYKIDHYDRSLPEVVDQRGKVAIYVNGSSRDDIKIASVDRDKGFFELDTDINPTDEIEMAFYIEASGYLILEDLELNPKIAGSTSWHISDFPNGIGVGIMPWATGEFAMYPYIYDLTSGTANQLLDVGMGVGSGINITSDFFKICELELNKLTTDMVKLTDARKVGGGIGDKKLLENWFKTNYSGIEIHEKEWYSDVGYYDGTPLPFSSTIIIHIPETTINTYRQRWIDYYKQNYPVAEAEKIGDKEFKRDLDQTIKRYISAGTDYILIPTVSGQITGKFLNLR
jgi:hypothetical protein